MKTLQEFLNEAVLSKKDLLVLKKIIDNEVKIAKDEDHPDLKKKLKSLNDLRSVKDIKTFVSKYKRITGASKYDLPDELLSLMD